MTGATISPGLPDDVLFILNPAVIWLRDDKGALGFYQTPLQKAPARRFTILETEILERISTGAARTEILDQIEVAPAELTKFLESLNIWGEGVLRWQNIETSKALADHVRLIEAARLRDIAMAMTATADGNDAFHRTQLRDAQRQFDQIETTISHIFRQPHVALDNRSYGQAFCDWLVASGRLKSPCKVIEIGCGLGYFASAILDRLQATYPDIYEGLSYSLFDLSPELQSAQKSRCSRHAGKTQFISGNIESFDFGDQKFDLALSNEVIADLSVATISLDNIESGSPQSEAEIVAQDFQLDCVPVAKGRERMAVINFGAIKMLQNLDKCLDDEGHAVLTEYGSHDQSPKAVRFANHDEYTVHFGQLEQVARQLGFDPDRGTMGEIIGFEADCETIRLESLRTLCDCLLPNLGRQALPVLAYTPASLKEALGELRDRIGNLQFLRMDDPASFSPFRFELLSLSKSGRKVD
jgi:SAM-dependent methyltransferase